jgi:large subunit ribosomal protein L15
LKVATIMNITEITKKAGANPKRWRVGRGEGSGSGKTSGRGNKGAGARSGCSKFELYEGGMFPFFRRIPKFGFSNVLFRSNYQVVNISDLESRFDAGTHVTPAALESAGLISDRTSPVKVLGDGKLAKKLTVDAHRFSKSASKAIEAAGGKVNWLGPKPKKKFVKRPKPVEAAAPEGKTEGKPEGKKSKKKGEPEAAAPAETEKKEGAE